GGPREGPDFQNLHRNKRSLTLDLKSPQGKDIFMKLVKTADVVVENYRPDVKDRLGIDYESLKKVNKRIILASISGFGQDGPYRARPGFDQIAQGLSGIMSALGIMTALLERESSGEGQWVQSSLLQAAIQLLDFQAARYTMSGEVPEQVGNDHPTSMPTSAYATSDGHINVAASGNKMWHIVCEAIGRPDLIEHKDYNSAEARAKNRKALNQEMACSLKTKTSAEWVEIMNKG